MKGDPELKEVGTCVKRIRRTGAGDLLLELDRSASSRVDEIRSSISSKLGESAKVSTLREECTIELKDLDELTTKSDICDALKSQVEGLTGLEESAVKSLRANHRGTQVAVLSLPTALARKAAALGRIRVGWVVSHVRLKTDPVRCFKCWEFGHRAPVCRGTDRTKLCRKCGEEGHVARSCSKEPSCALCNGKSGHSSGSNRCPVYQKALQSALRNRR